MNNRKTLVLLFFTSIFQYVSAQNAYQNIHVKIDVAESTISIENAINLPEGLLDANHSTFLYLNSSHLMFQYRHK